MPVETKHQQCELKVESKKLKVNAKCTNFITWNFITYLQASLVNAGEEGEDDARSACPFDTLGYTRDTMARTTRCDAAMLS